MNQQKLKMELTSQRDEKFWRTRSPSKIQRSRSNVWRTLAGDRAPIMSANESKRHGFIQQPSVYNSNLLTGTRVRPDYKHPLPNMDTILNKVPLGEELGANIAHPKPKERPTSGMLHKDEAMGAGRDGWKSKRIPHHKVSAARTDTVAARQCPPSPGIPRLRDIHRRFHRQNGVVSKRGPHRNIGRWRARNGLDGFNDWLTW